MRRSLLLTVGLCGLVCAAAANGQASSAGDTQIARSGPSLSTASQGSRWTLDLTPGPLRLWVDPATQQSYWFFTYKVVNRTGQDRMFAPRLELLTDDGKILRSGRDVPISALREIEKLLGNSLIEDQNEIIGDILVGPENAKEGLVIWTAPNTMVKEVTLFFGGLSGETTSIPHPETGKAVILAKTLARQYRTEGTPVLRPNEPLEALREDWVWR
jgi:hypothetical protein